MTRVETADFATHADTSNPLHVRGAAVSRQNLIRLLRELTAGWPLRQPAHVSANMAGAHEVEKPTR